MKAIKTFVKLFKAYQILEQLISEGFPNITVSESAGTGTFENEDKTWFIKLSSAKSKITNIEIV